MRSRSDESELMKLMLRWYELREVGRDLTPEELCADSPELVGELNRRIREFIEMDSLLHSEDRGAVEAYDPSHRKAQAIAQFRNLTLHAKGGLGEVYLARNDELNRDVALKFIRTEHEGRHDVHRRFLREAEVTARLEHPGIVPIHGLGEDEAGRPCYVMRFIQGKTFLEAIREFHAPGREGDREPSRHNRAFRSLIDRFRAVCATVAYAHSRGVLHRDLKPANILIGPYEETLVIDWGLAKLYRDDPEATTDRDHEPDRISVPGTETDPTRGIVGTRGYMSPEQQASDQTTLGPTTDVYSLGAILHVMLTGEPPVQEKLNDGKLLSDRRRGLTVCPALEAIRLKAMARRPEERYQTATALADDLENWLADERVTVWKEPWPVRLQRWARKHPKRVSACAATLLVGLIALVLASGVVAAKNRELSAAQLRSENRLNLALDAIENFQVAVERHVAIQNDPRLIPLRKELLREPFRFFQVLRSDLESQSDPDTTAQARLAKVLLATGWLTSRIDSETNSEEAYRTAIKVLSRLRASSPEDPKVPVQLASAHSNLAVVLHHTSRATEALRHHALARELNAALILDNPKDLDLQASLASTDANLGVVHKTLGHREEALASYEKARAELERLVVLEPENSNRLQRLAMVLVDLGLFNEDLGRIDEAIDHLLKGGDLYRRLSEKHPGVAEHREHLATSWRVLGRLKERSGDHDEALSRYEDALGVTEALSREHPADSQYRQALAENHEALGALRTSVGPIPRAVSHFEQARRLLKALVDEHPKNRDYQRSLAGCAISLGNLVGDVGRLTESGDLFAEAVEILDRLARQDPDVEEYVADLAAAHGSLGNYHRASRDWARAREHYQNALKHLDALVAKSPEIVRYQRDRGSIHNNLGMTFADEQRPIEARASYEQALKIRESLSHSHPDVPEHAINLALTHNNLGIVLKAMGATFDEVRNNYRRSIALMEGLLERFPDHAPARFQLAMTSHNLGIDLAREGRLEEAIILFQVAASHQKSLLERIPSRTDVRTLLNLHLQELAEAQRDLGRRKDAAATTLQRQALWPKDPVQLYNAACELALCMSLVGRDQSRLTSEERHERDQYATQAMNALRQSISAGFTDFRHMSLDPDLEALRSRNQYQLMMLDLAFPKSPFAMDP